MTGSPCPVSDGRCGDDGTRHPAGIAEYEWHSMLSAHAVSFPFRNGSREESCECNFPSEAVSYDMTSSSMLCNWGWTHGSGLCYKSLIIP